jgi:hypothetical protein
MQSSLGVSLVAEKIRLGENISVTGSLNPISNTSTVKLQVFGLDYNKTLSCSINPDGSFEASFKPPKSGNYSIVANSPETSVSFGVNGKELSFSVAEPPMYIKYSIQIIGILVALTVCGSLVYFFKLRKG